jgi:hypothetical protein
LEEQFFKLTWLLCSHYKGMLAAEQYVRDFGSFRTMPVSERVRDDDWWPIQDGGAVLVDGQRWGDGRDGVLPAFYRFVAVGCWNVGPVFSQMVFGAEREMARVFDVKDRTRGRSTDQLGPRNVHFDVPENMRPANEPCPYVMVARDITVNLFGSRVNVPWLDIAQALLSYERPRRVVLEERSRASSRLTDRRSRLTIVPLLPAPD